jgi:glucan phosphoethanolaminetransferase (alkaline phosphatase superfamily)
MDFCCTITAYIKGGMPMVERRKHTQSVTSFATLTLIALLFPNTALAFSYGGSGTGIPIYVITVSLFLVLLGSALHKKIIDAYEAALIVGLILFFVFAYFYDNTLPQS